MFVFNPLRRVFCINYQIFRIFMTFIENRVGVEVESQTPKSKLTRQVFDNPRGIDGVEKDVLVESLLAVATDGFMRQADGLLYEDIYVHVFDCDRLTVITNESGQALGFIAANVGLKEDKVLYHLGGIILMEEIQGKGVAKGFLAQELAECGADVMCFHTQSESMRRLGLSLAEPNLGLAVELFGDSCVLDYLDSGQAVERGRYYSRYGGSLYGDVGRFGDKAITDPGFDFLGGDAIVFAGFVRKGGSGE